MSGARSFDGGARVLDQAERTAREARRGERKLLGAVLGGALGALACALALDVGMGELTVGQLANAVRGPEAAGALGSLGEVMAALLGIALTVVAIVVQLASQRYPARIVDLFMTDPRNVRIFAFMTASCIFVVAAPLWVGAHGAPATVAFSLGITIANFALLLPYFGHVFAFLDPISIITRIKQRAEQGVGRCMTDRADLERHRGRVVDAIDRIADNSMAAVNQGDRNLAVHTIRALEGFVCEYIGRKGELPEGWAMVDAGVLSTLSEEFRAEILERATWVEAKTLLEYERIFRHALSGMSELVTQIAASTRAIGEAALAAGDTEIVEMSVRFFNTYIRHTLNSRGVRSAYNILYEYRQYASAMLAVDAALGERVARHLVYYGRTANTMGLPFVTVTAAHDVRVLCEQAHERGDVDMSTMLDLFLSLDQAVDDDSTELALQGVRRAQSILGAVLLARGDTELAQLIRDDMCEEPVARLVSIRDAILAVTERKFWEITDRGFNFDYVEPALRPHVSAFFAPLVVEGAARAAE
jgi:hypothetical protein